ncbi:unnamed protein product [Paramecium octaurelia]|uniref:RING-type domain-containing protein n=1 Tax=Paramecium octaurelia TaxID=43137 RepID=A0A8S1SDJ6_PAROT|nr:unnamed protein product [Paramecium octaurelia]
MFLRLRVIKILIAQTHLKREFKYSLLSIGQSLLYTLVKCHGWIFNLQLRDKDAGINPLIVRIVFIIIYELFNSIRSFNKQKYRYLAVLYQLVKHSRDISILVLAASLRVESLQHKDIHKTQKRAQIKTHIKMKLSTSQISLTGLNATTPFNSDDIIRQAEVLVSLLKSRILIVAYFFSYFRSTCGYVCNQINYFQYYAQNPMHLYQILFVLLCNRFWVQQSLCLQYYQIITQLCSLTRVPFRIKQRNAHIILQQLMETTILECNIWMVEYVENDKIIQLQYSNMHHFHVQCLQAWMKIKQQCPICRKWI